MKENEEVKLFLLDPEEEMEEYERVTNQFLLTLPRAHIFCEFNVCKTNICGRDIMTAAYE